jgi:hypothetical protein
MGVRGVNEEGMGGGWRGLNWSGRGDEEDEGEGVLIEAEGGVHERERMSSSGGTNGYNQESRTNTDDDVRGGGHAGMIYEVDQQSFDHLVLSTDMLSAHLNNAYKSAVENITTTTTLS